MKSVEDWISFFMEAIPKEITNTRWEHCLRVAKQAEKLAHINKFLNPRIAYFAGITHDITKQKKKEFHLQLFIAAKFTNFSEIPEEAYHAYSAPIYLHSKYGLENEEVFSAIRTHTLGSAAMTLIQKILYAADFLGSEYALKQTDLEIWETETYKNLQFGIYLKSAKTINNLIETKGQIYQATIDTFNSTLSHIR
ncbi:MAG: bis(5'-nucleosyl)-tetraphosphatase (symmetrical) YqeK [Leptospira sp.]|nr:bis(5'-nucleosyl)-tetraphosphatase (symmetrical) YqeK [Leptospira sp.]